MTFRNWARRLLCLRFPSRTPQERGKTFWRRSNQPSMTETPKSFWSRWPQQPVIHERPTSWYESQESLLAGSSIASTQFLTPESYLPPTPVSPIFRRQNIPGQRPSQASFQDLVLEIDRHGHDIQETFNSLRNHIPLPLPDIPISTSPMSLHHIHEALDFIGKAFAHLKYFITGLAAMNYHGFQQRLATYISVSCPISNRHIMHSWALSSGMQRNNNDPDSFGVILSDGTMREVKFKFLTSSFEDVKLPSGNDGQQANVLSLPYLADQLARRYIRSLAEHKPPMVQDAHNADIVWTLKQMYYRGEVFKHPQGLNAVKNAFKVPFGMLYPDTIRLFTAVGLNLRVPFAEGSSDLSVASVYPYGRLDDDGGDFPDYPCSMETLGSFEMATGAEVFTNASSFDLSLAQPLRLRRKPKSASLIVQFHNGE